MNGHGSNQQVELPLFVGHFCIGRSEESIKSRRDIGRLGKTLTKLAGQTLTKFPLNSKRHIASPQQRVQLGEPTSPVSGVRPQPQHEVGYGLAYKAQCRDDRREKRRSGPERRSSPLCQ